MIDVVTKYGLDMTGATDNAVKLALLAADIAALYAAGCGRTSGCSLLTGRRIDRA